MSIHSLWHVSYLSCCLEQDYVGSGKLTKLLCAAKTKNEDGGEARAAASRDPVHASVASACVNQLAVGALTLLGREAQERERAVQRVGGPCLAWSKHRRKQLDCVDGSRAWLMSQLQGGLPPASLRHYQGVPIALGVGVRRRTVSLR